MDELDKNPQNFRKGSIDDPEVIAQFNWLIKLAIFGFTSAIIMGFFPQRSNIGFAVATLGGIISLYAVPPRKLPLLQLLLLIFVWILIHVLWAAVLH